MDLKELLCHILSVFEKLEIPYFVTGSLASMFYGEPRFTNDADIVADIKEHHIAEFAAFFSPNEFYLDEMMISNAIIRKHQFNIIHPATGLKIDVYIYKKDSFDKSRFDRRKKIHLSEDITAYIASPEDVIIMKMIFYKEGGSEKHLRDIASMLKISSEDIDRAYIAKWAELLNIADIWEIIKKRTG
ncbi:MAG: hypothetical protein A2Y62_19345 [Candidatus Fischerbacteria bacterium RBG_13_37_8]|uniref:Uncharacterized protein n=1 Tax=Candidatus Fischerbacteria bacterium RBG_13_37_8 TaxID=1817863 RepID=A0A1F5VYB0_9BACT|nr:MAG: hypothetical protein A2Y62_19345 [Candidatus Fischerbacteria bacterium RBG_13_37_8]